MNVVFAGGGTGGHLMAGLSIAQEISSRLPGAQIIFFGTNKKTEAGYIGKSGYEFKQITACKLTSFIRLPLFFFVSLIGIIHSLVNLLRIRPDIIIGLGGYGSVLPVVAAYITGVPIVLIEQNVIPGRANIKMARWADAVLCHWESSKKRFKRGRVIVTGVPIRNDIIEHKMQGEDNPFGLGFQKKTLLIMGGSQGAQAINKVMLQSIPRLQELVPGLQVIHLTGKYGCQETKEAYNGMGISSFVSEFYNDIGAAYRLSDLVISRSGANTIAEITAVGVPVILIPYPYATDNHQYWNAYELSSAGGAIIIKQEELTSERVIKLVSDLLINDEKLNNMKKINKGLRKLFAAERVVDQIYHVIEEKKAKKKLFSFVHHV
ncbi:UDP-N-acetylglucosamine-N-acetylmuramyl-(Pentapeptide) pyrophosphoryl-undecaprenol N-acetylglucosamine transferase [Candidatus Scalindua japonica]|uniref:UDP-N-acetylglucosamine--N-acetylmuramyl-(pentapeptide) pyrophosphoryl-undecaprenol N-acetylglucosamine transferase n=1 Tax=Candidatus Scalindua japonica TaxID=1284222 RepID=A0A286U1R9_9BACT|nr:undecaprenyldiphospho-muramoylpentapeptide beta-N-acetylglucosaminyltransferase [Candidatus Scalindua japonica]GAX62090.1 UDP-N-acetylglucosamine-N-acetylmuramyl-(Pentapeptide) pyrophosphoryl-undecaprenol N-acetylglucosamine transferase [Candidatus Scalindua japonica]